MDWLNEIKSFPGFDIKKFNQEISEKEAVQANSKYNKALKNALNDSLDIAIIELRKLSVLYPDVGQIALLLGCCQMNEQKPTEALKNFNKAAAGGMTLDLEAKLPKYIQSANEDIIAIQENKNNGQKSKRIVPATPAIIEASSNRWKRTKVASEREKKEIMKKLNSSNKQETFVKEHHSFNWFKFVVTFSIIGLAVAVILVMAFSLPDAIRKLRSTQIEYSERLEWLLDRLEEEKDDNTKIEQILSEYDLKYFPPEQSEQTKTPWDNSPTPAGSLTPTPTLAPIVTPAPTISDRVMEASILIQEANDIGRDNPAQVYLNIVEAKEMIKGIDDNAKAIGVDITKGDIDTDIERLMRNVVNAACYPFYRDGVVTMENEEYEEAIELFLAAHEIYPEYLDGINAYNLAKSYSGAGMVEQANELFNYLIDKYPDSDIASWSQWRIIPVETP